MANTPSKKRVPQRPKSRQSTSPKIPSEVHHPEVLPAESELDSVDDGENGDREIEIEAESVEPGEASALPSSEAVPVSSEISDSDVSAISPSDPLRRYLDEVRRYPMLEPQEEFELAMKLRNEGDMTAAKRLVTANLRLVVKIAMEYRSLYTNLLDLVQEGNVGLMKAVSKFDPTKGARLGYYASWWIRSYILKYLLDNFRLVRIGTTQAQKKLFYHLVREKERLEAQGLMAGPKLLAEKLNVREKDVVEMEQRLTGRGAETSLDAPMDRDGDSNRGTFVDALVDPRETADETLARQELLELLKDKLPEFQKKLNDRELRILSDRLLAEEPKTLQEVADLYGLTRERARQIEAKVVAKLKDFLQL
jgi:RNA polymerase sigma-32 factor